MLDILLIDKPKGITSFDCIRVLRRKLCVKKMGHAGTLDPMATGLMIIGIGEGTKRLQEFLKLPKTYEAEILLGVSTDTGDITGKILKELRSMPARLNDSSRSGGNYELWKDREMEIREILGGMVGKLELPVPAYSAIKRGGEALYKKARRGEIFESPIKTMEVRTAEFLGITWSRNLHLAFAHGREQMLKRQNQNEGAKERKEGMIVKARFEVSSGTYVRSLAEEFGRRLGRTNFAKENLRGRGIPATLAGLRRTRIGTFKIEDAQTF